MQSAHYRLDPLNRLIAPTPDPRGDDQHESAQFLQTYQHQPLGAYISCHETLRLYELLLASVRRDRRSIHFDWRCDDATTRRHMHMTLSPEADDHILVRSDIVHETQRPTLAFLDLATTRDSRTVMTCSWCQKLRISAFMWVEIEAAIDAVDLDCSPLPSIQHAVCPECRITYQQLATSAA